jgi:hypothetical protein
MKKCQVCKEMRDDWWFNGKSSKCKYCKRITTIKSMYGLSLEDYNNIYIKQGGKCAICERHQSKLDKVFLIDHDHKAQKVRGLLCRRCNTGLGMIGDDIVSIKRILKYLEDAIEE